MATTAPDRTPTSHRVIVCSTPTCPWCTRAKTYLRGRGVIIESADLVAILRDAPVDAVAA